HTMRAAGISAVAALAVPLALGVPAALSAPASAQTQLDTHLGAQAQTQAQAESDADTQHPGWEALSTRRDDRVQFQLTGNPGSVAVDEHFQVGVNITNTAGSAIDNVQVTARRGQEVTDAESAQQQLAHGDFPFYGASIFPDAMEPNEEATGEIDIATGLNNDATLGIDKPDIYPIMLSLTGTVDGEPVALADERFLLTVTDADGTLPDDEAPPQASTVIYPITAQTHIAPGEVGDSPL